MFGKEHESHHSCGPKVVPLLLLLFAFGRHSGLGSGALRESSHAGQHGRADGASPNDDLGHWAVLGLFFCLGSGQ